MKLLLLLSPLSYVCFFETPHTAACQASLSFTVSQSLLKLMSIEIVMASNHLILCHPLLFLLSIFPSTMVFPNESALHIRWPVLNLLKIMSTESMILSCPSHPLPPPSSLFTFKLSQYQDFFQWVSSLNQVAKVLDFQLQLQSFQWIFRVDFLWDWLLWCPCGPRHSQESFPVPQFERINSSVMRKWRYIAKIVLKWFLNSIYVGWKEIIILSKFIQTPSTLADTA